MTLISDLLRDCERSPTWAQVPSWQLRVVCAFVESCGLGDSLRAFVAERVAAEQSRREQAVTRRLPTLERSCPHRRTRVTGRTSLGDGDVVCEDCGAFVRVFDPG